MLSEPRQVINRFEIAQAYGRFHGGAVIVGSKVHLVLNLNGVPADARSRRSEFVIGYLLNPDVFVFGFNFPPTHPNSFCE